MAMLHLVQHRKLQFRQFNMKGYPSIYNYLHKKTMKAIISNGRRTQMFQGQLQFSQLNNFIGQTFPRMKETQLTFKDTQGNIVNIKSNEDIDLLKKMYNGQNFVELAITGVRNHGHGHHWHGHSHKHRHMNNQTELNESYSPEHRHSKRKQFGSINRKQRRLNILAKVYGGLPQDYSVFQTENADLKLGQLINKYGEVNNVSGMESKKPSIEKRKRVFEKIFGLAEQGTYEKFLEQNKDLRFGQLIRKFGKGEGKTFSKEKQFKNRCCDNKEGKLQKLCKLFEKPKQELTKFVDENSGLNFRQMLKILVENGLTLDKAKLCQMRKGRRQFKHENRQNKGNWGKHCKKSSQKSKSKNKQVIITQESSIDNNDSPTIIKKKNVLKTLRTLFGTLQTKEYAIFIDENISLGEAEIIDKWIEKSQQ